MPRTASTHTASPTRFRSPQRDAAHDQSQDGSQYEMDLDALGLNSTFESTELEGAREPPVDHVDTSEIEGPEDFTLNMTYWMTAELPPAQIKSRKEANAKRTALRMDMMREDSHETEEGYEHVDFRKHHIDIRTNIATNERHDNVNETDQSMENEEKVRSFLSALPDSEMDGALAGTPLQAFQQSYLQVPASSPPKSRSLQATVEDSDTPRKPTQETVIHHTMITNGASGMESHDESQSQIDPQALATQTRIVELETTLSYTRKELEEMRNDNYRHKDKVAILEQELKEQKVNIAQRDTSVETERKARELAQDARMEEFSEEMRLQNLAKLQHQREDYEQRLKVLEEFKRSSLEEAAARIQELQQANRELAQLKQGATRSTLSTTETVSEKAKIDDRLSEDHASLLKRFAALESRAGTLEAQLQKATTDAKNAREEADESSSKQAVFNSRYQEQKTRLSDLESRLQTAQFEVECSQADVAAKQQLFQTNLDLNTKIRTTQSQLDALQAMLSREDAPRAEDPRLVTMLSSLEGLRQEIRHKDQQIMEHIHAREQSEQQLSGSQGRYESLESTANSLRQQLAEVHRSNAKSRSDAERLEQDLDDARNRLHESEVEAARRITNAEKRFTDMRDAKAEVSKQLKDLQDLREDLVEGQEAMLTGVRDKAEDAIRQARKLLDQEKSEKKRVVSELKRVTEELEGLRLENVREGASEEDSDDDSDVARTALTADKSEAEITSLKTIIRTQISQIKSLKSETVTLRKTNRKLNTVSDATSDLHSTISILESQLQVLRKENLNLQSKLQVQEQDFEAINAAMDEKLASMLSKVMKERVKQVVGKRDGQWTESVEKIQSEKELLGKVVMRQWGREEIGIADEKHGEPQEYAYKYVKRSKGT